MKTKDSGPRVRFNWGFWDARHEARHGTERRVVSCGAHDHCQVSASRCPHYHAGYRAGLEWAGSNEPDDSEPAWLDYQRRG
jgi:hypothetical protein